MKDTDQIAAEAAKRAENEVPLLLTLTEASDLEHIIKSAIEKATEPLQSEINRLALIVATDSRAAHASGCICADGFGMNLSCRIHGQPAHASEPPQSRDRQGADTNGVRLIANERNRQITSKGWSAGHDDQHVEGELVQAALCYLTNGRIKWPWPDSLPKTTSMRTKELVIAGALIAAEIDRIDRRFGIDAALSQRPTANHDNACICMYCKPELWPNDIEENKYRDLAAERWNQLEAERKRLDWLERNTQSSDQHRRMKVIFPMETVTFTSLRDAIDAAMKREET